MSGLERVVAMGAVEEEDVVEEDKMEVLREQMRSGKGEASSC